MKTLAISVLASFALFGCASSSSLPQKAAVVAPTMAVAPAAAPPPAAPATTTTTGANVDGPVADPWVSTKQAQSRPPTDAEISGLDRKVWDVLHGKYRVAMHAAIDSMHRGDYATATKQIKTYRIELERAVGSNASQLFIHRFCVRAEEGFAAIRTNQKSVKARKLAMCETAEALVAMDPVTCDFELVLHMAHLGASGGRCGELTGTGVTISPRSDLPKERH